MKNYIVTLLLSLLVVLVGVTLRRSVTKAATAQTKAESPMVAIAPSENILPQVGFGPGPMPCPPACGGFRAK